MTPSDQPCKVPKVAPSDPSLWRDRNFNLFWIGQTLSTMGSAFTAVAIPLLIYRATGSVAGMALITACSAGGGLISGIFSGRIVDATERRRLMVVTDLLRAILMVSVPVLSSLHVLSLPLLGAVSFCVGLLGNLFGVTYTAFVSELVSKARVIEANARLQASAAVSYVVGPALAGMAAQAWGAETAVGIDALSFLASLGSLLLLRGTWARPEPRQASERFVGVRFILATPVLRVLMLILAVEVFATAAAIDMFTFHLKGTLGQSDLSVGGMFAGASVGAVAGAVLLPLLRRRIGTHALYVVTAAGMALAFALVPFAGSVFLTLLVAVTFTLGSTLRGVLSMSRRQQVTPDALLGRVTAAFWLVLDGARMIGAATVGYLAQSLGTNWAFQAMAAGLLGLALVAISSRSLRE